MKKFGYINKAAQRAYMALPENIREQFGLDIHALQHGQAPFSDSDDVSGSVGKGSIELKENGSPAYRAVYCAKYLDTVFILHAFTKTTNAVDRQAMETAAGRYKLLTAMHQDHLKQQKLASKKKAPKKNPPGKKR